MFADGSLGVRRIWWLLRCSHLMVPLCIVCVSCWGSSHCRVWGGPVPSCFAACLPPNLGLFLFLLARSLLLVCSAGGGQHVAPCLPLWLWGCPTCSWVVPGAPGTFAHVSKSTN